MQQSQRETKNPKGENKGGELKEKKKFGTAE